MFATVNESTSPGSASPESTSPGSASPESTSPGSASPESTSPGSASPESASPGSAQWWRERYQRRLRARGRGLTIEKICEAALVILDRDGLAELTMRRLADELGTGPASLYRHVTSREELLVEVADRVLGELRPPDESLGWHSAIEYVAHDLRRVLLTHRAVVLVIANGPLLGPNAMRIRELFWKVMDRDGCDAQFAVQTYFTVVHFVVCSALFSAGTARHRATATDGPASSGLSMLLDVLPARQYPTVLKFSEYGDKPDPDYDFDFGLRALLDGLARSH